MARYKNDDNYNRKKKPLGKELQSISVHLKLLPLICFLSIPANLLQGFRLSVVDPFQLLDLILQILDPLKKLARGYMTSH
jgi:hypothetical protein